MEKVFYDSDDYINIGLICNEVVADYEAQAEYYKKVVHDIEAEICEAKANKDIPLLEALKEKQQRYDRFFMNSDKKVSQIKSFVNHYFTMLGLTEVNNIYKDYFSDQAAGVIVNEGKRNINLQELDRSRISVDLHDTVIQLLTGIIHKCELSLRLFEIDEVRAKLEVASMVGDLKNAVLDLRNIIFDLRPPSLSDFNLSDAILNYCVFKNKGNSIEFSVSNVGDVYKLPDMINMNIYRIAQEACNNIISHSKAHKAVFTVYYSEKEVTLNIKDDGVGFSNEIFNSQDYVGHHFGILIMKERAEFLKGKFDLVFPAEGGTEIIVSIPVEG